jgi:pilus assembly protein CpaB
MNRGRMLIIAVVALILSVGIWYIAYSLLKANLKPAEITVKLVAASKKLELGALVTKDDIHLVEWPKATPVAGSFSDPDKVVGRALMTPVQVNEPILESKLAPKEAGAGLTAVIPPGMRALSIQVNSVIGVSGFVMPGSRVDLVLIATPPSDVKGARKDEVASKIILENLEVLAAGQNVQRDVEGKPQTVQDVTLLVTPEQAQKVALATQGGRIQLALRNPMDKLAAEPPLSIQSELYTGPTMERPESEKSKSAPSERPVAAKKAGTRPVPTQSAKPAAARKAAPPPPVVQPAPAPRIISVELIQGAKRSTQDFEEQEPEAKETPEPSEPNR